MTSRDGPDFDAGLNRLESHARVTFLLALASELTLAARDSYVEVGVAIAASQRSLRCLNELQIVVVAQLAATVQGMEPAYPDAAFLSVLGEKAETGGQLQHLEHALRRAAAQSGPTDQGSNT